MLTSPITLNRLIIALTQQELVEDPHDWIATAVGHTIIQVSGDTQLLGSVYLLVHGLAKVLLVGGYCGRNDGHISSPSGFCVCS